MRLSSDPWTSEQSGTPLHNRLWHTNPRLYVCINLHSTRLVASMGNSWVPGQYSTPEEVWTDLQLIWSNCRTFNGADSQVRCERMCGCAPPPESQAHQYHGLMPQRDGWCV